MPGSGPGATRMAREWALRNSSLGGQRGERAAPVKEASQKGFLGTPVLKSGYGSRRPRDEWRNVMLASELPMLAPRP